MRVHEGSCGDVDLCGYEAYAELNDFNYFTGSIEQSHAVRIWCRIFSVHLFILI